MSLKQYVLKISRSKVTAAEIEVGKEAKIKSGFEYEISGINGVKDVIVDAAQKLKTEKFVAVIDDELCYILNLELDKNNGDDRKVLFGKIQEIVPDELEDSDWDYKLISEENDKKKVIVFALVKELKKQLEQAAVENNLWIQSIEPESLAKTRNSDAIIGVCLRQDEGKKDEDNLELETKKETESGVDVLKIAKVAGAILLAAGGLWFGIDRLVNNGKSGTIAESTTSPTPTEIVQPTATPVPAENPETWQVLNGSGITGLAGKWSADLEKLGYEDIKTGNADNSDYEVTEVSIRKESFSKKVLEDLSSKGITEGNINIDGSIDYDVIVILGKDN